MSKESVQVRKDASACLMARKVFSAEGSRLTFRKSRTLPGSIIGCDEPRPRGLFFLCAKSLTSSEVIVSFDGIYEQKLMHKSH